MNSYLTCARQYYFAYIRKLPRRAKSYFSFGTSLHGALQEFHAQGGARTQQVGDLISQLDTAWVDAGYATREEEAARRDAGQQILATYFEEAGQQESETLLVEKTLSIPQPGFVLTGRVDRIDRRPDGLLEVMDYKSGGYLPTETELADDLAIGVYQLLVARTMQSAPVVGTIYNLRLCESTSIVRADPELHEVELGVQDLYGKLSTDDEFRPAPGTHCRFCDFVSYCPVAQRR